MSDTIRPGVFCFPVFYPKFKDYKVNRILVLAAVFYKHQNIILREEHSMRVFENRVLRRLFGTDRDEVIGEWRRLNSEDLMICAPHQMLFRRSNEEE